MYSVPPGLSMRCTDEMNRAVSSTGMCSNTSINTTASNWPGESSASMSALSSAKNHVVLYLRLLLVLLQRLHLELHLSLANLGGQGRDEEDKARDDGKHKDHDEDAEASPASRPLEHEPPPAPSPAEPDHENNYTVMKRLSDTLVSCSSRERSANSACSRHNDPHQHHQPSVAP